MVMRPLEPVTQAGGCLLHGEWGGGAGETQAGQPWLHGQNAGARVKSPRARLLPGRLWHRGAAPQGQAWPSPPLSLWLHWALLLPTNLFLSGVWEGGRFSKKGGRLEVCTGNKSANLEVTLKAKCTNKPMAQHRPCHVMDVRSSRTPCRGRVNQPGTALPLEQVVYAWPF